MPPKAIICGLSGPDLLPEERAFFTEIDPFGFILFARNVETPDQVRRLTDSLREASGRADLPILIDQEGGRVQRLRQPAFEEAPPAGTIGEVAQADRDAGRRAAYLHTLLIGAQLFDLGITVDCVPCLDLRIPGASAVIGDRSYGADPGQVADLGAAAIEGIRAAGIVPVIKHLPGHGRALVDSHHELPRLDEALDLLTQSDFRPFRECGAGAWGMTAHLVLAEVDPDRPVTQSPQCIERIIRGDIGFDGLLMTDDLSMQALSGSMGERAEASMAAGCDLVLHCNGKLEEMREAAEATPPLSGPAQERLATTPVFTEQPDFDRAAAAAEFSRLLTRTAG